MILCGFCGRKLSHRGSCPSCTKRSSVAVGLGFALLLGGCCKQQVCPPPPAPRIITVQRHCDLPALKLPAFKRAASCLPDHVCFDKVNAGQLYLRLARLRDFAKAARTRCGAPASQPTSYPASEPTVKNKQPGQP